MEEYRTKSVSFFVLQVSRWNNRICHPRIFSGTNGNPCGKTAPWFTSSGYECAGGGSVKVSGLSYYLKNMFSRKLRIKLTKSPSFQRYELRPQRRDLYRHYGLFKSRFDVCEPNFFDRYLDKNKNYNFTSTCASLVTVNITSLFVIFSRYSLELLSLLIVSS